MNEEDERYKQTSGNKCGVMEVMISFGSSSSSFFVTAEDGTAAGTEEEEDEEEPMIEYRIIEHT